MNGIWIYECHLYSSFFFSATFFSLFSYILNGLIGFLFSYMNYNFSHGLNELSSFCAVT